MSDWSGWPMNDVVRWPVGQKTIGVLGVAPLATADFFRRLSLRRVRKDWEHPRVLIDSNPKIPSRGRYLELGETDPVPWLRRGIADLAAAGADVVAVPCNTAHILHDRYAADAPVPVPSIIVVTAARAAGLSRSGAAVILASRQVIARKLYDAALAEHVRSGGAEAEVVPFPDQDAVSAAIEAVKQGDAAEADRLAAHLLRRLEASAPQGSSVVFGCTELSALFREEDFVERGLVPVDSNQALADWCHDFCNQDADMEDC